MGPNNKKKHKNRNKKKDRQNAISQNAQVSEDKSEHLQEDDTETDYDKRESVIHNSIDKKRHLDEDSDDNQDDKPRKKKKKKQAVESDTPDKKGKKSIRQLKREKFAQRQAEAEAMAKDNLKSQCLNYLSQWKHDKQNWKFMKAKQVWLYKNKFSTSLLPNSSWPLLLEYFESAQGNIRKMLLDDAKKIIKQMDEWTESQTKENNEEEQNDNDIDEDSAAKKPDDDIYKRARDLIQCLEE